MEKRSNREVLEELLPIKGSTIVDVGCGDGALVRMLTRRSAHVIGIEVSPRQLARARAIPPVGDERYMPGLAEELPVRNHYADIVIFFNSFHHVDEKHLPAALKEAARVLKPGGTLYISEPLADGPYFELMKPAHDETRVRRNALEALHHAAEYGLLLEKVLGHIDTVKIKDFESFRERITSINPESRQRFLEYEEEIRANFYHLGNKVEDGWTFEQPMRVFLFRRS